EFKTQVIPAQTSAGVSPAYTSLGMDQVVFELAPNPGQGFKPLEKIASGGELSRIMLALKTVLAKTDPTRTLIFDEVDSGISGGVAEKVGQKQKMLGKTHQVLCITHLPQIAALGHHHLLVQKISGQDQTFTRVSELAGEEKISEVARLLSGLNISAHSIRSAEDMVKRGSEAAD
ncbi:MAG: DNA repair protein RecN, partial [Deltaproteobacteria bacterium]|nr:DNA repair protein RecN [Deltaproteobacteria bacterium]